MFPADSWLHIPFFIINFPEPNESTVLNFNSTTRYRKENKDLEAEKQELLDTAAKSQGDLGAYQQDLAKASAQKSDLEKELSDAQAR